MPGKHVAEDTKLQAVALFRDGFTSEQIEKQLGVGHSSVCRWRIAAGIPKHVGRPSIRQHSLNERAFDNLSAAACYWLGFMFADGYVSRSGGTVRLTLSGTDSAHVSEFATFLGTDMPLKFIASEDLPFNNRGATVLQISSVRIANRLRELGMGIPKAERRIPGVLINSRDFWRGIIDGDGTLGIYRYKQEKFVLQLASMPSLVVPFARYASHTLGCDGKNLRTVGKMLLVSLRSRQARLMAKHLYSSGGPSLMRKEAIALEMMKREREMYPNG